MKTRASWALLPIVIGTGFWFTSLTGGDLVCDPTAALRFWELYDARFDGTGLSIDTTASVLFVRNHPRQNFYTRWCFVPGQVYPLDRNAQHLFLLATRAASSATEGAEGAPIRASPRGVDKPPDGPQEVSGFELTVAPAAATAR